MENVINVQYEDKSIILVGTAHVSKDSAELVKQVISQEQPDAVCVELDEGRYQNIRNPKQWENTDIVSVIKSKRVGFLLANLALGAYQKKIAQKLHTAVGQEMIQGIKSADEMNTVLVLADRNIQTTFLRIWRKLRFFEKCKLLSSFFFSSEGDEITEADLQELMQKDMLESALSDMRSQFPKIGEILIHERDQHLAYKIKTAPGQKIVAVLGAAHVPGVEKELFKNQDLEVITSIPPKGKTGKIISWTIPVVILALIGYGFITSIQTGFQQIYTWLIWNSSLAGLFTAFALAHPLTILVSVVTAPLTSLNPLLACGWFAGLTEAALRKPTVRDVNNAPADITSLKGFYRNRFLRILLIVIMANIGSTIGTYVAGSEIIRNLLF